MNPENYKSKRKGQPKRNSPISRSKSRMLAMAKELKPINAPKLRAIYSTRIEWAIKIIPKLKEK